MGTFSRLAMYKRFARLNAHSMLLRQAELIHLETQLQTMISVDQDEGHDVHSVFDHMLEAERSASPGSPVHERWQLMLDIRKKLDEYSKLR